MRWILVSAGIIGASSIIAGAALRHMVGDTEILQTALRYHQLHSVVLLPLGLYALDKEFSLRICVSAILFIFGIIIFSGSLYLSAILPWPFLTMLTPVGGMAFILGWLSLGFITRSNN